MSGVFMLTMPLSPNSWLGLPVLASREYNLPSLEPKTICGVVLASPAQYSTPRVEGPPAGSWYVQISLPLVGSMATTREYGVDKYMTPSITNGVTSLDRNPDPPPRPRPLPAPPPASGFSPSP